ncbi:MerC domain-containing protein [Sphingomonas oligophenolica]|uniref:MerC domain-containing protein n=1 Tax=Sphingomonas oligophenolica TaxID=301154 RepID=A0A502CII4_9SPHN|nr:MerC domain-containing protein [Sphingomonas oligophenolica]TPG12460.1 MerC domain-containing protein [Sphingomonas oligophenolica]
MTTAIRPPLLAGLDRIAIALSGLCVVHCLASAVLLAMLSAAGGVLLNPIFHEIGLTFAIILGAIALGRGVMEHGYAMPAMMGSLGLGVMGGAMHLPHDGSGLETLWTVIGVGLLAFGHDLNRRATY